MSAVPQLSIGLPVYNGETYLAESLDALLGQSQHDFGQAFAVATGRKILGSATPPTAQHRRCAGSALLFPAAVQTGTAAEQMRTRAGAR